MQTRAKQGQESSERTKERDWRLEKGGQNFQKGQAKKERRKKDTVSRGGMLAMGMAEMIGGSDLQRGARGPPRNRD